MKVFVIGGGGREHALVWKLRQGGRASQIFCAPGNGGIAGEAEIVPLKVEDLEGLIRFAKKQSIDLTVVGPELPLTLGVVDRFQKEGLAIFGPVKAGAILEGSKAWTKRFLREEGIPTAHFEVFEQFDRAVEFLKTQAYPVVIKADGLAAGKGVLIAKDRIEALEGLESIFQKKVFGEAGRRVVIEEFLKGEEASFLALVDGKTILPLDSSQDHKRVGDNDQGPNTGGMGAYSPAPVVTGPVRKQVMEKILVPTLEGLRKRGIEYRGVLYAGLMIDAGEAKLLEYNVRFGDPETQALLVRLEDDLVDVMEMTITGKLPVGARSPRPGEGTSPLRWKGGSSVCVVMAAHGYPGGIQVGDEIQGLKEAASITDTVVFHAGTKRENGVLKTAGGRVLGVTSWGKDLHQARERAYDACEKIHWKGVHYRRDIGLRGMGR